MRVFAFLSAHRWRSGRAAVLAATLVFTATACATTSEKFVPLAPKPFGPATSKPIEVKQADLSALRAAGVQKVGNLVLEGNAFTDTEWLIKHARCVAAERGATHFLVTAGTRRDSDEIGTTTTTSSPPPSASPPPMTSPEGESSPSGKIARSWVIVAFGRVPPENWARLPNNLRPDPVGSGPVKCE
jgi:hypothetical protein